MKSKILKLLSLIVLLTVAGSVGYWLNRQEPGQVVRLDSRILLQDKFARVAERCIPAVVVVTTSRKVAVLENPYANMYDYLYGSGKVTYRQIPTGQGSGFFIRPDGYILTNYHIVRGQSYFKVVLSDGTEYDAKLAGTDPPSDLALLKINADRKFPFLTFADTSKVKPGHWAIAIGAPFSLAHTVTVGIVSQTKRTVGLNLHENYIQTDASINPGNSGGPLLDLKGNVIGVNDFILSPSAGNIGLSFAISGSLAEGISKELIQAGKVDRPWLGVTMRRLTDDEKRQLGVKHGVAVTGVYRMSPAHKAEIIAGDVILEVDDKKVKAPHDVQMAVLNKHPGEIMRLTMWRNGLCFEVQVKMTRPPENFIPRQGYGQ
jgi:serine protease Do